MTEDLSPELESLKEDIEMSAGVDESIKDTIPTTDSVAGGIVADTKGAAMNKAKEAMAGVAASSEGLSSDEEELNEEEVALTDIDGDATGTTPDVEDPVVEETINYEEIDTPEPEPEMFDDPSPATPNITDEMRAEARDQFGIAQRVASMLPAEYELWLFPKIGSPGYHEGVVTLARIINNLTSAGYNKDSLGYDAIVYPKVVQIAGATWSQTNYAGGDVVSTRDQLTLAPASQVVDLLPALDTITHDIMSPAFPTVESIEVDIIETPKKSYMGPALVGIASLAAVVMPILLVRRSMDKV